MIVSKTGGTIPRIDFVISLENGRVFKFAYPNTYVVSIQPISTYVYEDFNTKSCPISKSANGWAKFANGLIIQWGTVTILNNTSPVRIKLPIMYSTGTSYVSLCSTIKNINDVYKEVFSRAICNVDNANIEIASAYNSSSGARWLTIGY